MSTHNLNKLFNPRSIAVIGASSRVGSVGELIVRNIQNFNFSGTIWPINPGCSSVRGIACSSEIQEIDTEIDLAIIATSIHEVPSIIKGCTQGKVHSVLIVSDGRRTDPCERKKIESDIKRTAYEKNIRVMGPNSLGLINQAAGLNVSYSTSMPKPGKMAFISQSGSIFSATLDMALKERVGFSHLISAGAMLDIDFADLVDYLGQDTSVDSILVYMENLTHARKFISAARAVSLIKPIVILKSGMQREDVRFGRDFEKSTYTAAFQRAGIISVDSIDDLFDCGELMAKQPRPKGSRLVVINNGSAPGFKALDAFSQYRIPPYALKPETINTLDNALPSYWSRENPINLMSGAGVESYVHAAKACLEDRDIDGLLLTMAPDAGVSPSEVAKALCKAVKEARIPVMASWYGGRDMEGGKQIFNTANIPTFRTPEKAVRAFSHLLNYQRNQEMILEVPAKLNASMTFDRDTAGALIRESDKNNGDHLTIPETAALLNSYGIPHVPTRQADNPEEAVSIAREIGFPVVAKNMAQGRDEHIGCAAALNLKDSDEVRSAFEIQSTRAKTHSVCLQPYLTRPDYKFLIGFRKHPLFGPVLIFGMGGIFSIVLNEVSYGLPPLNRLLARRLIEKIRAFHLLQGYRNHPPLDLELLEEQLIRLAQLAVDFPQIDRLHINPLVVKDGKVMALDASIRVIPTQVKSPGHLVISPYPKSQEKNAAAKDGTLFFIRPVRPEDTPLIVAFRKTLSEISVYYRFFRNIKTFTPEQLHRFTTIDYDREIALIALSDDEIEERMLGVVRIKRRPDGKNGDFYIIVSDDCQSKGIGSTLLRAALKIAKKKGFKTIFGQVLPENDGMKQMARNMGFDTRFNFDEIVVDLRMDLPDWDG